MKINFSRAVLAGIAGTIVFDLIGLAIAGTLWDIPILLAGKLAVPFGAGLALHYTIGTTLAVIYAALAPSLPGNRWVKPQLFMTVQTVLGVWLFMMPLLGAGVAGLGASAAFPVISLVRHWGYGLALGLVYPVGRAQELERKGGRGVLKSSKVFTAGLLALVASSVLVAGGVTPVTAARAKTAAVVSTTQVKYRTIEIDGQSIFYREAGSPDAPALLLLHGFPTSSHMFRNLIPALADQFHLVAPDYPGYGNSSMPAVDEFEYTFDNFSEIIEKLTVKLGLNRYSLYLMDYGAPVGFRLAAKHPERVESLIIQNGNAYVEGIDNDFWEPIKEYWKDRDAVNKGLDNDWWKNVKAAYKQPNMSNDDALRFLVTLGATQWQYTNGVRNEETISPDNWHVTQRLLDRPGNAEIQLQLFYDYGSNPPLYPSWQAYFRQHQPRTLIVWGANDEIFPAAGAYPYERDLKNLELHLFDTGHFALEEDGKVIAERIRDFLTVSTKKPRRTRTKTPRAARVTP